MPVALLIPGLVFFGALVLLALAQTSAITSRSQTEAQASFWHTILQAVTGRTYVKAITTQFRAAVSRWALAQLAPVTRWFVALNAVLVAHIAAIKTAETETAAAVERLRNVIIPRAVAGKVAPVAKAAHTAHQAAQAATAKATSTNTALTHYQTAQGTRNAHYTHAVDVALPGRITNVRDDLDVLSRDEKALRERTKALENGAVKTFEWIRAHPLAGATGVFAGAVAVALARLGFGFLRCRTWRDVGRRVTCGMGKWMGALLDLVATFALALLGVLNPEALAAVTVRAVDVIEPKLEALLSSAESTKKLEGDIERFASFLGLG